MIDVGNDACRKCCGTSVVMDEASGPPLPGRPEGLAVGFQAAPCPECKAAP